MRPTALKRVVRRAIVRIRWAHRLLVFRYHARTDNLGGRPVLCIGDSHATVFSSSPALRNWGRYRFYPVAISGATNLGLANPNSRSNAGGDLRRVLRWAGRRGDILTVMGEIDCGFLLHYRQEQLGMDLEVEVDRSLANYRGLLTEALRDRSGVVYVLSVPMPTIPDGTPWGEVANARASVRADRRTRTQLTKRYNARLRSIAHGIGAVFVDVSHFELDPSTGEVRKEFMNRDPRDHHHDAVQYGEAILSALSDVVDDTAERLS